MTAKILIAVGSLLFAGWVSWASLGITDSTPRDVHDRDFKELRQDIKEQQGVMVDKLERIWEKIK
jgi:hypothetical protein